MATPIVCLMGPTASGKTQLALNVAQHRPVEIVSVDSALVYRGLDIGAAKPSAEILQQIPHHLINICDPAESYSGGQFCQDVLRLIPQIQARNALPILTGGTMLYFNLLRQGFTKLPEADLNIRKELELETEQQGLAELYARLKKIDPQTAQRLKAQDTQRIQRALELYYATGKTLTEIHQAQTKNAFPYPVINFILMPNDRSVLHQRIAQRFDQMLAAGFITEVEALYQRGDLTTAMPSIRTVGYRQAWSYLVGEIDYELMREKAIAATRQLAKRQLTWLRQWDAKDYYDPEDLNLIQKLLCSLGL